MKTSSEGVAAIRGYEGCLLKAYRDVSGVWTIGVGHTGPEVHDGLVWTQAQADAQLAADLKHFEDVVSVAVKAPLAQGQFDALVSLCFNIGAVAFAGSTLVKKLNAGDTRGAGLQFVSWNKAGGQFNGALLARRACELWMFARASA